MAHAAASHARHAKEAQRLWTLGQNHARAERWEAALDAHRAATRLAPGDAVYALNHARALRARGQLEGAGNEALRAFQLDPALSPALTFALDCLVRHNRSYDAVALLDSLSPEARKDPEFHALRASALQRQGRPTDAVAAFFDALAQRPQEAQLHHNLGLCFSDLQLDEEAAHCFNTALLLGVGDYEIGTRGLACFAERVACCWDETAPHLAALHDAALALPEDACLHTAPFAHAVLATDRTEQLKAARACARFLAIGVQALPFSASRPADWQPGARALRVGYVSADFHGHATAILLTELLERHDREHFEITLYSHGPNDGGPMRQRIEAACSRFVEIGGLSDRDAAKRIRSDGIDLLVDLKGHTKDNRLGLFAFRPAPVQASYLGFPGTSGADYIDYVIGDPVVTPIEHSADYSEHIAQMPRCYQPNDRQRALPPPPSRAAQGLPDDALVLCGFNQPYKISPEVLDSWCRLLKSLPNAVLWLLDWAPKALPRLRVEAARRGIDAARIIGAPRTEPDAHIARLRLADLFIDTWPCTAHTTASDALWAGVPVVTQIGETFAARVAASLLQAVGTPELICTDTAGYEATVLALARDPQRRAALRAHLATARDTAPLFDSERSTRDIEALYLRMALRHAQGLAPDHLLAGG